MKNHVKRKLAAGQVSIGGWNMIGHPIVAEILAQAGFDWVALDMEHGVMDWPQAVTQMQVLQANGCLPLCRLPVNAPTYFSRALDGGAAGVIVPMIRSVEDAQQAVAAARYPPAGIRGVGVCRAHHYGAAFEEYVTEANEQTLIVLQIEHIDAVEHIEAICAVPGVDAVFIGPYDLSGSLGVLGQLYHPDVEQAIAHTFEVARGAGVAPGLHIVNPQPGEIDRRIQEGFRLIAAGLDTGLLVNALRNMLATVTSPEHTR